MPVIMKPASIIKINLGIQPSGPIHAFFTAECAKAMDRYVPAREGTLAATVINNGQPTNNVKVNTITYDQNYASYVYYGITKNGNKMNYTKEKHPEAGPYWDKRMWSVKKKDIIDSVQKEVNKRGGK